MYLIEEIRNEDKPILFVDPKGDTGNAFFIVGKIRQAYEKLNRMDVVEEFVKRACSGDHVQFTTVLREYVVFVVWHDSDVPNADIHPETEREKVYLHMLGFTTVQEFGG